MSAQRAQSFCLPDTQVKLLEALRSKNIERFWSILQYSDVSCDQWYDDPYYATLLEITCQNLEYCQFVTALLECGADPNAINPVRKVASIHVAAEVGNYEALQALVSSPKLNINAQDSYGNTALHICAKRLAPNSEIYERCISLLINQPKIQINIVNRKGYTALHMIVLNGSAEIVHEIIKNTKHIYNIDTFRSFDGRTTREVIVQKFPELEEFLPPFTLLNEEDTEVVLLFYYLYNNDCESFISTIQNKNSEQCQTLIDKSDGKYTFLQLACERGQTEVVKVLLESGANPLKITDGCKQAPAMIAAYNGYYHILEWFIFYRTKNFVDSGSETIIHTAVQGVKSKPSLHSNADRDHNKCLRLLLDNIKDLILDINQVDSKGNSALHYAAKNGDESSVFMLLSHGAYIGHTNLFEQMPIQFMSAETLERFLDSCLETNGELSREENFEVSFKYNFLSPPLDNSYTAEEMSSKRSYQIPHIAETTPLLYISQSKELKQLLKHPIIISFLFLKWFQIRKYYYYNVTFYGLFVLFLTVYIFVDYTSSLPTDIKQNAWGLQMIFQCLIILFPMLVLREALQLLFLPSLYLKTIENYLELLLIAVSAEILYSYYSEDSLKQPLSAAAILLSWTEMVLLVGRHPSLSTNIEMLKRVSLNFLMFLMWYAILILAFALSFYILFHGCSKSQCDGGENFFERPSTSIFKTILMITGELEAESIPFSLFPGISHVIFILFVFLITIVLYNLLNGLAVSDTQRIKNEAELVSYEYRVNLIYHFEIVLLCKLAKSMNRMSKYCSEKLMVLAKPIGKGFLFPALLPDKMIRVFPNQDLRIVFTMNYKKIKSRSCNNLCNETVMDAGILKAAMEILSRKKKITLFDIKERLDSTEKQMRSFRQDLHNYEIRLKRYGPRFDSIDDSWKQAEEKMDRVLRWLETVSNTNHSSLSGNDS